MATVGAIYSDLNQGLPTLSAFFVEDASSVIQSLFNILTTEPAERFFNPEFGVQSQDYLFELMDDITTQQLESALISAIERWDPRILIDRGRSFINPDQDNNRYNMLLVYTLVGVDNQDFSYQGTIERE